MQVPSQTQNRSWEEENYRYLIKAIARVRTAVERIIPPKEDENHTPIGNIEILEDSGMSPPSALETICEIFSLHPFERDILLLCAGMEYNPTLELIFTKAQPNSARSYPTLSLALTAFPDAYWQALTPGSPLRWWHMIELGDSKTLTTSPLRIDERILHYLFGIHSLDERLVGMIEPMPSNEPLVPSHQQLAENIAAIWLQPSGRQFSAVQLCGEEVGCKKAIAAVASSLARFTLHPITAEMIPRETTQLNRILRLWERESLLTNSVILLNCDWVDTTDTGKETAIARFLETINRPLIITSRERRRLRERPLVTYDVHLPTPDEQRFIWANNLGEMESRLNGHIDTIVAHFSLSPPAIQSACLKVKSLDKGRKGELDNSIAPINHQLWDICRVQARPRLDELAQRIDSAADWDDLILPERERSILKDIAVHVRQRAKVYESWGFATKSRRGLGLSALFSGQSGTGKTMAAEVLAKTLNLDVYRIDLSSVVSKYIGETEKNLRRVFDAAEGGGTILLFDEADAIFGKRSDVKDSHDRYANMEISYLLQRMEAYRGLAILTTNLKTAIDSAFLRRIRFVVQFPFPDLQQREEIWKRIFPKKTPTEGLDYHKLAALHVAGGNIRNIAMNAAFLAAEAGEAVMMKHLLQSAKSEYVKLERPMTDNEVRGWV
ncbi:MAG: ATP-binding protein [Moorea sp. SIO2B7]|nr:ATP-binding protein [Moorena sp. SIO2B7]